MKIIMAGVYASSVAQTCRARRAPSADLSAYQRRAFKIEEAEAIAKNSWHPHMHAPDRSTGSFGQDRVFCFASFGQDLVT